MAVCMGPHHRGKNGSSGRTCWAGALGSARFRPGTGGLDRSDSAMGAQEIQVLRSEVDAFLSLKTDCNSRRFRQVQQRVYHPKNPKKEKTTKEILQQTQTWKHEKHEKGARGNKE